MNDLRFSFLVTEVNGTLLKLANSAGPCSLEVWRPFARRSTTIFRHLTTTSTPLSMVISGIRDSQSMILITKQARSTIMIGFARSGSRAELCITRPLPIVEMFLLRVCIRHESSLGRPDYPAGHGDTNTMELFWSCSISVDNSYSARMAPRDRYKQFFGKSSWARLIGTSLVHPWQAWSIITFSKGGRRAVCTVIEKRSWLLPLMKKAASTNRVTNPEITSSSEELILDDRSLIAPHNISVFASAKQE